MTSDEAIEMVAKVLADCSRIDRWLRRADDGTYFTTPDRTFLGNDGPYTPPAVFIPVAYHGTDEETRQWAADLLDELDDLDPDDEENDDEDTATEPTSPDVPAGWDHV